MGFSILCDFIPAAMTQVAFGVAVSHSRQGMLDHLGTGWAKRRAGSENSNSGNHSTRLRRNSLELPFIFGEQEGIHQQKTCLQLPNILDPTSPRWWLPQGPQGTLAHHISHSCGFRVMGFRTASCRHGRSTGTLTPVSCHGFFIFIFPL